ncbi:MAG TPA: pseudouridine synthase [Anaerolineales bacterium]|jgi:23S rRNA pseudouridine2605 synthase|nr:pseudouridine synthase [Anaerolineales bacterium]
MRFFCTGIRWLGGDENSKLSFDPVCEGTWTTSGYNLLIMLERLQKILAQAGYGSRRACEDFISAGRVRVNGQLATLGQKADPAIDKITMDGRPIAGAETLTYIALYKPRNVLSTVERERGDDRKTVRDLIEDSGHLYPVGRLDFESEGLILMTNDGDLANRLTHPRYGHEKEYRVLLARRPDREQVEAWGRGVVLEDGYKTQPVDIHYETSQGKGAWVRVIMGEGRKRQIRETCKQLGLPIVRILRIRIGSLRIGGLKPRQWRHLTKDEIDDLKSSSSKKPQPKKTDTVKRTNRR